MDEEKKFIPSRSMMDSLKMDASILTPEEDARVKHVARLVSNELFSTYKRFIPKETRVRNRNVADRILVTERSALETMYTDWDTEAWPIPLSAEDRALSLRAGDVIIFDDPNKLWNLCTPRLQKELIGEYGSLEEAKKVVVKNAFYDFVAHEVVHQYQYPYLPEVFHECAVRYYQRETVKKLGGGFLKDPYTEVAISFYKEMLDLYGDELHNLYFNGKIEPERQQEIYWKFEKAKNKIFPSGQGLRLK